MSHAPVLTIVIAGPPGGGAPLFAVLREHLSAVAVELILCGGVVATPIDLPTGWRVVRLAADDPHRMVPEWWGAGLRVAGAPLVAFFSSDTVPTADWWPRLRDALADPTVAAAAGGIVLQSETPADDAVYFCRYSVFLPRKDHQAVDATALPGEATVYRRAALLADARLRQDREGFWEVAHHHRLRGDGWRLRWLNEPLALFIGRPGFVAFVQQRARHGRRFGAERVASGVSRVGVLMRAPFVPAVMLLRSVRRVAEASTGWRALPGALPRLAVYFGAWALGEALGAWRGPGD